MRLKCKNCRRTSNSFNNNLCKRFLLGPKIFIDKLIKIGSYKIKTSDQTPIKDSPTINLTKNPSQHLSQVNQFNPIHLLVFLI